MASHPQTSYMHIEQEKTKESSVAHSLVIYLDIICVGYNKNTIEYYPVQKEDKWNMVI